MPVSGRATADPARTATILARTPAYVGCGEIDSFFAGQSKVMHEALGAAGHADLVFRAVPNGNHFSYSVIYTDREFWDWLFARRLSVRPATRPTTQPTQ